MQVSCRSIVRSSFFLASPSPFRSNLRIATPAFSRAMSAVPSDTSGTSTPQQQSGNAQAAKRELKILMLHGFTQSGPRFRGKTRALEKMLAKTLAPASISPVMIYPSGPNPLEPSDVPGFDKDLAAESGEVIEMFCWFRKVDYPTPADGSAKPKDKYRLFDTGMDTVAEAIREAGGVDAVCGFSQGGAMTGFVASALEPGRVIPEGSEHDWARKLREANGGKGVKFAIAWCGFAGTPPELQWLYEPKIKTPTLHMLGSLDEVVDESRSQALIDRCENPQVITHPGGHHVPVAKQWTMPVAGFIRQHFQDETPQAGL